MHKSFNHIPIKNRRIAKKKLKVSEPSQQTAQGQSAPIFFNFPFKGNTTFKDIVTENVQRRELRYTIIIHHTRTQHELQRR